MQGDEGARTCGLTDGGSCVSYTSAASSLALVSASRARQRGNRGTHDIGESCVLVGRCHGGWINPIPIEESESAIRGNQETWMRAGARGCKREGRGNGDRAVSPLSPSID